MTNTNITNFRKNIFEYVNQTINYNDVINVSTKDGNAILISEEEYNSLLETLYLCSMPGMEKSIIDGMNEPIEDCISEKDLEW